MYILYLYIYIYTRFFLSAPSRIGQSSAAESGGSAAGLPARGRPASPLWSPREEETVSPLIFPRGGDRLPSCLPARGRPESPGSSAARGRVVRNRPG